MEEILWPAFGNNDGYEENRALEIINFQVQALESLTKGKVRAVFSESLFENKANIALKEIAKHAKTVKNSESSQLPPSLEGKKDVNDLFASRTYVFDVCNNDYRFRVFSIRYTINYPMMVEIDEGIAKEVGNGTYFKSISNNDDLKQLLKKIFASKKMYTIINYIMMNK